MGERGERESKHNKYCTMDYLRLHVCWSAFLGGDDDVGNSVSEIGGRACISLPHSVEKDHLYLYFQIIVTNFYEMRKKEERSKQSQTNNKAKQHVHAFMHKSCHNIL